MSSDERRKAGRTAARLTVLLNNQESGRVLRVLTKNLSTRGICVVMDKRLSTGTQLMVDLKLPDREAPLTVHGDVIWSRPTGGPRKSYEQPEMETGIRFLNLTMKELAAIKQAAVFYGFS